MNLLGSSVLRNHRVCSAGITTSHQLEEEVGRKKGGRERDEDEKGRRREGGGERVLPAQEMNLYLLLVLT